MFSKKQKMKKLSIVLNKRIEIGNIDFVTDEDGFKKEQFISITRSWAKVSNLSGTEVFKSGADFSKVKTRFLIRYRKDIMINTDMKLNLIKNFTILSM